MARDEALILRRVIAIGDEPEPNIVALGGRESVGDGLDVLFRGCDVGTHAPRHVHHEAEVEEVGPGWRVRGSLP